MKIAARKSAAKAGDYLRYRVIAPLDGIWSCATTYVTTNDMLIELDIWASIIPWESHQKAQKVIRMLHSIARTFPTLVRKVCKILWQ